MMIDLRIVLALVRESMKAMLKLSSLGLLDLPPSLSLNCIFNKICLLRITLLFSGVVAKLNLNFSVSTKMPMLRLMHSKSNYFSLMISSLSHEIKTPLAKILMMLSLKERTSMETGNRGNLV